jgi:signal transduction histidine kinase
MGGARVRGIPRGIGAKLFTGFFLTAVPILLATGLLLEWQTRRALEAELGRRVESLTLAISTAIPGDTWQLLFALGPGEEESRIARHLRARLDQVERATGVERIAVWTLGGTLVLDTRAELPIGSPAPRAELLRSELLRVAEGRGAASTPLFRSEKGRWVKLGLAPLRAAEGTATGPAAAAGEAAGEDPAQLLGVLVAEAPAESLGVVAAMRRTLALVGALGVVLMAIAAYAYAGALTRRIHRLARVARDVESGDLESVAGDFGRDEIGSLAGALDAMRQAVKLREQHLRAMLGGVSHEIRNPLGGLMLNAELLARDPALSAEERERARRILGEATHLERIVAEFLAYARPERPVRSEIALDTLVEECAGAARDSLRWPGELVVATGALSAWGDTGHVRQVLLNLMLNAMQAAGEAGRVRVRTEQGNMGPCVSVEDSGPGIPPAERERIFEPFYTTRAQGAGLGLAIVKRLCELGGLAIDVGESAFGGACFRVHWGPPEKE